MQYSIIVIFNNIRIIDFCSVNPLVKCVVKKTKWFSVLTLLHNEWSL